MVKSPSALMAPCRGDVSRRGWDDEDCAICAWPCLLHEVEMAFGLALRISLRRLCVCAVVLRAGRNGGAVGDGQERRGAVTVYAEGERCWSRPAVADFQDCDRAMCSGGLAGDEGSRDS